MQSDSAFTKSLPDVYDAHLGPLFFLPYAEDMGERASALHALRVLELASGTGIATAALAKRLPEAQIEATDLNEGMVALAASRRRLPAVRWSVADAMALPFEDDAFDLVVCQFGVMFFSDRVRAFRETRRVLKSGGTFLFNVWDGLEHNDVARIVSAAAVASFPCDPPLFIERTPHGHADPMPIQRDLRDTGFARVTSELVTKRSRAPSARDAAVGICEGTPLRNEIIARDPKRLGEVVDAATRALEDWSRLRSTNPSRLGFAQSARRRLSDKSDKLLENTLGHGAIEGTMRAYVFEAK